MLPRRARLALVALFAACASPSAPTTPPVGTPPAAAPAAVQQIVLAPATATLVIGDTLRLTATLVDAAGRTLTGRAVTFVSSAPGVATVGAVVGAGLVTGFTTGSVTITATSEGQSARAVLTVEPRASASYGLAYAATGGSTDQFFAAVPLVRATGARWTRLGISWAAVQPSLNTPPGWTEVDAKVNAVTAVGGDVLAVLLDVAPWATSAPDTASAARRTHAPPRDYAVWGSYVYGTVAHFRDRVHAWEVWSEPDVSATWNGSAADYAHLLSVAYAQIKRADPSATVLVGGLALQGDPRAWDADFLRKILTDATYPAARSFDVLGVHHYGRPELAQAHLDYVKGELARVGAAARKVWVTETGYASRAQQQSVAGYLDGEAGQARWLRDDVPLLFRSGAEKVFWAQPYDDTARDDGLGLLDATLRPKAAYATFQQVIAGTPGGP